MKLSDLRYFRVRVFVFSVKLMSGTGLIVKLYKLFCAELNPLSLTPKKNSKGSICHFVNKNQGPPDR